MLPRLIVGAAILNFILSAFLIVSIVTYDKKVEFTPIVVPPAVGENNTPPTNDGGSPDKKPVEEDNPIEQPSGNATLNKEEMERLLGSRNPFDVAPVVDKQYQEEEEAYKQRMKELQEKIEKELEEQKKKESEEATTNQGTPPTNGTKPNEDGTTDGDKPEGTDNQGEQESPSKTFLTNGEAKKIADEMAKKYNIPVNWVMSVIETSSKYQVDLVSNKDGAIRRGIMQYREDKAKFIAERIGIVYVKSKDLNATMNIELGSSYLSYLSKQNTEMKNKDLHYIFSAYYSGESSAKALKSSQGNYETEFSKSIIKLIND